MTSKGVGIVGCGLIGSKRLKSLPDNCFPVYLFDIDKSAAEKLRSTSGVAVVVSSMDEILADSRIGIVIVSTTHADLADTAIRAAKSGKHVLIEKPGARNATELKDVLRESKIQDVVVQVGFNHRFHPAIQMAKRLIDSGRYGNLLWLRGRYGHGGRKGYEKEWRADPSISGGGELLDQGSHLIDITQFLFGPYSLAYSHLTTAFWDMKVEDNAFLLLQPTAGGTAWLHASWTDWKNTFSLEIVLRTAKLDICGLGGSYGTETLTLHEMSEEMGPPMSQSWSWEASDNSWELEFADFLQRISGLDSQGTSLTDAITTLNTIGRAYSS